MPVGQYDRTQSKRDGCVDWNEQRISLLRKLWVQIENDTTLSTAEIGKRMNLSKHAVVGKAHRLNLPPRPSPIRPKGAGALPRVKRVRRLRTLPMFATAVQPEPAPQPERCVDTGRTCQWPFGHPRVLGFRFCGCPIPRYPYCEEHMEIAYLKREVADG